MLEKPDLPDEKISASLQDHYGVSVTQIVFLPLGADINTAVYRAVATDERVYFVKVRRGFFDETSVTLPKFLSDQGIAEIIAPLATQTGQLWAAFDEYTVILYPFVAGNNGYAVALSDRHWRIFGAALKQIHTAPVPPALQQHIQCESYSAQARTSVKKFLSALDGPFTDPVSIQLAALLQAKRTELLALVERTERLAQVLQAHSSPLIVCHSDIHAGNILIDNNDNFYIVDWDNPILAPKERDLMYVGGGQGFIGHTAQEEETLFYQGYGPTALDPFALAYYRYERIIQDIAAYCEQLFLSDEGGEDREQSLRYVASNFLPDGVLAIAYRADQTPFAP